MKHLKTYLIFDQKTDSESVYEEGDEFMINAIKAIKDENIPIEEKVIGEGDMYYYWFEIDKKYYKVTEYWLTITDTNKEIRISNKYYKQVKEIYEKQRRESIPNVSDFGRAVNKYNL